jgi:hypothetical protein
MDVDGIARTLRAEHHNGTNAPYIIEPPKVKGYGFSKDQEPSPIAGTDLNIEEIRHIRMPAQLRKFAGRQYSKIEMAQMGKVVEDLVKSGLSYREIADWLTSTSTDGVVYSDNNVSNYLKKAHRYDKKVS